MPRPTRLKTAAAAAAATPQQKGLLWYYLTGHQLDTACQALRFASAASLDADWNKRCDELADELRRQEATTRVQPGPQAVPGD